MAHFLLLLLLLLLLPLLADAGIVDDSKKKALSLIFQPSMLLAITPLRAAFSRTKHVHRLAT